MIEMKNIQKASAADISIGDRGNNYFFEFSEIIYISIHSKSIIIHTQKKDIKISIMVKDIIDKLPPDLFTRIHKQYIVNVTKIQQISHVISGRYKITLKDEKNTELPVGRAYFK